jgi:hypothetical protein
MPTTVPAPSTVAVLVLPDDHVVSAFDVMAVAETVADKVASIDLKPARACR